MSQVEFYSELRGASSHARLTRYFTHTSGMDDLEAFSLYLWNISLCESLYPVLQGVEVTLRNSIHQAAAATFGDEFWFQSRLFAREQETILKVASSLGSTAKQVHSGRYISECSLGFWVGLFRGEYEQVLWTSLLPKVFPHAPRGIRSRSRLYQRLDRIRRLRNRVFHHEPIWHLPDLPQQHRLILDTIGWISPAMLAMTRLLDRFDSVYTRGAQHYATELESIARNWNT